MHSCAPVSLTRMARSQKARLISPTLRTPLPVRATVVRAFFAFAAALYNTIT